VHVASAGGVWTALVYGFGGLRDHGGKITLDPRLPETWNELSFKVTLRGARLRVDVRQHELTLTVEDGDAADVSVRGMPVHVTAATPVVVPLSHQGTRMPGAPKSSTGKMRADGTVITSSIPTIARPTEVHQ
jgi:alpha,alpha-trehalose phosphorylase